VDLEDETFQAGLSTSELSVVNNPFWLYFTLVLQTGIALMVLLALIAWLRHREARGQRVATFALVLSLVLNQPLLFYMNQLAALAGTLYQFVFLLILLAYRRYYLPAQD
jgi:4-amino-4-deoxy-L-arabinose transferase-like glycosyltransferase